MKYNTKFSLAKYGAVAEDIAAKFFDENGEYTPLVGEVNAMCIFYNECVDKEDLPDHFPAVIENLSGIDAIANDEDFINAYNSACEWEGYGIDFTNAYMTAKDMVEDKKSSFGRVFNAVSTGIKQIIKELDEGLSPEMISNFKKIAESIGDGNNLAEAIVKEYGEFAFKK